MLPEAELAPHGLVHVCGLVLPRRLEPALVDFEFRVGPNNATRREDGWADPEVEATWTLGAESRLVLPMPATSGPLLLELVVSTSLAPPHLVSRPLQINVGGVDLAPIVVAGAGTYNVELPRECVGDGRLEFRFRHPIVTSPRDLGVSPDDRPLAISFHRLRVRQLRG